MFPGKMTSFLAAGSLAMIASQSLSAQGVDPVEVARQTRDVVRSMICPGAQFSFAEIGDPELNRIAPAKVFDNLYQLGMKSVSAWALDTGDGLILFESMFDYTVRDNVVGYLERLGLDPGDIKYVILTHAHTDHYGGAKHLQDAYGARIVMSEIEWQHMHASQRLGPNPPAEFPRWDIAVRDGDTLTLGDTTIRFLQTPGHTPGTLSLVFPVREGDETHYVGYLGGSGVRGSIADVVQFMAAVDYLAFYDDRIDVGISNHPFADGSMVKREALQDRRSRDSNPFVLGNDGYKEWLSVVRQCAGEHLAQKVAEASRPSR